MTSASASEWILFDDANLGVKSLPDSDGTTSPGTVSPNAVSDDDVANRILNSLDERIVEMQLLKFKEGTVTPDMTPPNEKQEENVSEAPKIDTVVPNEKNGETKPDDDETKTDDCDDANDAIVRMIMMMMTLSATVFAVYRFLLSVLAVCL